MKKNICVVSVQIEVAALHNEDNIKKSLNIMTAAVKENGSVDLFVLPEDFITGPIPNHTDTHCLNNDSAEIRTFRSFAKQNKCYVVLGSFIKKIDNKLYNTTLVIDRFGETILEHKKTNLWLSERSYLSPGVQQEVVKTDIGTIGILNCWEISNPETCRRLVEKGADILCCPSWWSTRDSSTRLRRLNPDSDVFFINTILPARSVESSAFVIYSNISGKNNTLKLKTKEVSLAGAGQSQICSPSTGVIKRLSKDQKDTYVSALLDRSQLAIIEQSYQIRKDMGRELEPSKA